MNHAIINMQNISNTSHLLDIYIYQISYIAQSAKCYWCHPLSERQLRREDHAGPWQAHEDAARAQGHQAHGDEAEGPRRQAALGRPHEAFGGDHHAEHRGEHGAQRGGDEAHGEGQGA